MSDTILPTGVRASQTVKALAKSAVKQGETKGAGKLEQACKDFESPLCEPDDAADAKNRSPGRIAQRGPSREDLYRDVGQRNGQIDLEPTRNRAGSHDVSPVVSHRCRGKTAVNRNNFSSFLNKGRYHHQVVLFTLPVR